MIFDYIQKQIEFVKKFFKSLDSKDRKKVITFFLLSIFNNFIDFILVFLTLILFENGSDLFSKIFFISITSIIYMVLKILHSRFRYHFTDLTYTFRYSQIYKIGNEILKTDFELLQSDTEQLKIEKAYFSIFSGGNKGLEFQLNEFLEGLSLTVVYILSVIVVFFFNPVYSVISILLFSISFFMISIYTKIKTKYKEFLDNNIATTNFLISQEIKKENILDTKYTRRLDKLLSKNYCLNNEYSDIFKKMTRKTLIFETVEQFLPWLGLLILLLVSKQYIDYKNSLSSIMVIIMLVNYLLNQTNRLFRTLRNVYENFESVENWSQYFKDKVYLKSSIINDKYLNTFLQKDINIRFDKIYYRAKDEGDYILSDISFKITDKDKIAIVGTNGSGKTTLVNIILGLLKPSSGDIYINNQKVKYEQYKAIAKYMFSILPQENSLFNLTISENISLSDNKNDLKIYEAIDKVGLSKKISDLTKGVDSELNSQEDNNGVEFSGGERRLLLLSRVVYFQRNFGIFDEATSALDPSKESMFYDLVKNKLQHVGMIFVSHKVGSTKFSDEILVLDKGNIVQRGKHEELITSEGIYRNMFVDEDEMEGIDENNQ